MSKLKQLLLRLAEEAAGEVLQELLTESDSKPKGRKSKPKSGSTSSPKKKGV
jgi:hypothetical protein